MPPETSLPLTADELLAADRLFAELLAERGNTVDLGSTVAPRTPELEFDEPAAAAG